MATLLLTAVGTAIGGPIGGALGALAGRAFDQAVLLKPKGREGPRLSDLHLQTSSYGSQIPQLFGAMRVAGTVIWATDLRESKTKSGGGKGQPSITSYSYSASFAVALSARRIGSVGRIWADGNLLRGEAGDFKSALGAFRLHDGGQDQAVDPLIASAQGIAVTPAHRGIAYALFEDLQLADFGNRIPSLTFEIFADDDAVGIGAIASVLSEGAVTGGEVGSVAGYAASGADRRSALQPLADAGGLLLTDEGGGLALTGPGGAETMLARGALAAQVNGKAVTPVERSRAVADSVPVQLSLRHYDPARDYQAGVQKAVRQGPGRRSGAIDLPATLEADAARALAAGRLNAAWAGRSGLELVCGWDALPIAPGALLRIEGEAGRWQVLTSEWEDMAVRLALRRVAGAPALIAGASAGTPVRQVDAPHGPTQLRLLDLPPVGDEPATAPILVAAAAGASDQWRRAALFVVAPGSGEASPVGESALPTRMGMVTVPPAAGSVALADLGGAIEVEMLADWMIPEPADDAALAGGANLCLAGGELLQFGDVTQLGPKRFRLTRLWRGRRGTQGAVGGHVAGEPFTLIEAERLFAVPATLAHRGSALTMIAIGIGDAEPAMATCSVAGAALSPPSPVGLDVAQDGEGGTIVRWTRRSRCGWRWSDGVDAPLGEEREAYAVRVLDGAVLVRAVEVSAPTWTYDAAMQASDAAAGHGGALTIEIAQSGTYAPGQASVGMLRA